MRLTRSFLTFVAALGMLAGAAIAQSTPNIGLEIPAQNSTRWDIPINYDMTQLDLYLSGNLGIPGLLVNGGIVANNTTVNNATVTSNLTVDGNILFPNYSTSHIATAANPVTVYALNRGYAQAVIHAATSTYTITADDCGNLLLFNNSSSVAITAPNPSALPTLCIIHIAAPTAAGLTITPTTGGLMNSAAAYGQNSYTIPPGTDVDLLADATLYFVAGISAASGSVNATSIQSNPVAGGTPVTGQGYFWNGTAFALDFSSAQGDPGEITGGSHCVLTPSASNLTTDNNCSLDGFGDLSTTTVTTTSLSFGGAAATNFTGAASYLVTANPTAIQSNKNLVSGDGHGNVQTGTLLGLSGTSPSYGGSTLATNVCQAATTFTVTGAVVGHPVIASASDGTLPGSFEVKASVSATNTVSLQICATAAGTAPTKTYNVVIF